MGFSFLLLFLCVLCLILSFLNEKEARLLLLRLSSGKRYWVLFVTFQKQRVLSDDEDNKYLSFALNERDVIAPLWAFRLKESPFLLPYLKNSEKEALKYS